ncbi:class I SAM-dependent methyltransferase [Rugosimonospora africana]|uniref:SAM-dependent methyltransferase n=1 Tax=Rugosimonospora africana TaxID=556532 RepID=A0A8J3QSI6_9ACTN|nr:class I SAM-dependent methyltransferase [Rugosimonospora africana]GIH14843.1 SAM-dependent methyltransferase [Rugosimonospora africana]
MHPIADYWDRAAEEFDREPDHGLGHPPTRAAWAARLAAWIPDAPLDVLDLGCGTGTLSVVLARQGHRVTGLDLSGRMVERARVKLTEAGFGTAGLDARVLVGDAADPPLRRHAFDVILARHVLWTLPDPPAVLRRWVGLLRPRGRLVLVEGRWAPATAAAAAAGPYTEAGSDTGGRPDTGGGTLPWFGGVGAAILSATLAPMVATLDIEPLTDPVLWGRTVDDERYAALARLN